MFLAWCNTLAFVAKFRIVGIYALVFIQICKTFLRIVLLTLLLIVTFGITFYMIFYDPVVQVQSLSLMNHKSSTHSWYFFFFTVGKYIEGVATY